MICTTPLAITCSKFERPIKTERGTGHKCAHKAIHLINGKSKQENENEKGEKKRRITSVVHS